VFITAKIKGSTASQIRPLNAVAVKHGLIKNADFINGVHTIEIKRK